MTKFAYQVSDPEGPAMGLIVLSTDETLEQELRQDIAAHKLRLYISRIQHAPDVTPETLTQMDARLSDAASLLPEPVGFDVIGYACTSATAQLGAETVASRVRAGRATRNVTDPLTAAIAFAHSQGIGRLGIVSPYTSDVAETLVAGFEAAGIEVPHVFNFEEKNEAQVVRIDPSSTAEAARKVVASAELDGLFLSCTNLRTQSIRSDLEAELGLPVFSSNHALMWHMLKLAGLSGV